MFPTAIIIEITLENHFKLGYHFSVTLNGVKGLANSGRFSAEFILSEANMLRMTSFPVAGNAALFLALCA